jgi:hypothetical protein
MSIPAAYFTSVEDRWQRFSDSHGRHGGFERVRDPARILLGADFHTYLLRTRRTPAHAAPSRGWRMELSTAQHQLREQFLMTLLQAALPLQTGPDRELTLELLIQAADMLKEQLENELAELRQEEAD